jgi:NAD(P)-dependent dehydrogenase (short-subunit alcohol dehydrogenase family)
MVSCCRLTAGLLVEGVASGRIEQFLRSNNMDLQLNNRTCLITGASQGIGKGTARVMAAEGCRVVLLARRKALLEELADEIAETGAARPRVIDEDITEEGAPERIRDRVYDALGGLDIIVNCAGGSRPIPWDAPDDIWHEGMTLNFEMLRRLTQQFIPKMREQPHARRRPLRAWLSHFKTTGKDQAEDDGNPALAIPQIRRLIS